MGCPKPQIGHSDMTHSNLHCTGFFAKVFPGGILYARFLAGCSSEDYVQELWEAVSMSLQTCVGCVKDAVSNSKADGTRISSVDIQSNQILSRELLHVATMDNVSPWHIQLAICTSVSISPVDNIMRIPHPPQALHDSLSSVIRR